MVHRSMMSFGCSCTIPRDYSVAVCCSMLQCVAVCVAHRSMISFGCSSTMPYDCSYQKMMCCKYREVEVCWTAVATYCNTLQHTTTHCNSLQLTATHCNSLQHTTTHCNSLQLTATQRKSAAILVAFSGATTHCNTMQLSATHCNSAASSLSFLALQHTVTY